MMIKFFGNGTPTKQRQKEIRSIYAANCESYLFSRVWISTIQSIRDKCRIGNVIEGVDSK